MHYIYDALWFLSFLVIVWKKQIIYSADADFIYLFNFQL